MKNNELDRLFREKLKNLQQEPSPHAWQQLEEQVKQTKRRKIWYYFPGIAASLLLFFGLWTVIEFSSTILPKEPVAEKQELTEENNAEKAERPTIGKATEPDRQDIPSAYQQKEPSNPVNKEEVKGNARKEKVNRLPKAINGPEASSSAAKVSSTTPAPPEKHAIDLKAIEGQALKYAFSATSKSTAPQQIQMELPEAVIIQYKVDRDEKEESEYEGSKFTESSSQVNNELSARKVIGLFKKIKSSGTGNLAELREAKDELLDFRFGKTN